MNLLAAHSDSIKAACSAHNVRTLSVFGSILTDRFNENSDVDMIVDIAESDPLIYADHYFNLKDQLEAILQRTVDLLEKKQIKNPFLRQEIEQKQVLVYAV